jgi:hypothetical protein
LPIGRKKLCDFYFILFFSAIDAIYALYTRC